jgi:sulfur carrier protein ThiS
VKIRVRLYGTLRGSLPGDEPPEGIEVEMPEGATAGDLLDLLGIAGSRGAVVVMDGRVLAADGGLKAGTAVHIFQAIGGG